MAVKRKKYLLPAAASAAVVGLGQVIKGEAGKGLKIMLWFYLGFPIIFYGSLLLNAYLFLAAFAAFVVLYPVIWVFNILDAYMMQPRARRHI